MCHVEDPGKMLIVLLATNHSVVTSADQLSVFCLPR